MNFISLRARIIALLFWQGCSLQVAAQLVELPNIQLISEKDGLPHNSSTSFIQDKRGFIWVSSVDGLVRYDGYSFVTVQNKPNDSTTLPNNTVLTIAVDKSGMIWAGHLGGYVSRIDPQTFKVWFTRVEGAEETSIYKMFCDSRGTVWCTVSGKGIYKLDRDRFRLICALNDLPQKGVAPPNNYNVINDFYEDEQHNLWLGTNNGLYLFHPNNNLLEHISSVGDPNTPAFINRLVPDKNGFWFATYGTGLIHYDLLTKKHDEYLFQKGFKGTNNIIYGAARKSDHEIWLGTNGAGIGFFDTVKKKFNFFLENRDLGSGPMCTALMVDKSGIIWVLSDKGLHKWDVNENHFLFYKVPVTRSDNYNYYGVNDVLKDELNNRLIIGTSFADGVHIIDTTGNEKIIPFPIHPNAEPYLIVNDILKDKKGNINILTRDFLFRLTPDNQLKKVEKINTLLPGAMVPYYYRIIESENGDLWVLSSRTGLYHLNSQTNQWERLYPDLVGKPTEDKTLGILEDHDHKIWLMHSRAGVSVYDQKKKSWINYRHDSGKPLSLVSNILSDMTITPKGDVYISSYEGLSKFNPSTNSFINITASDQLPTNLIYSLESDQEGILWASTNKGLLMIDPATWNPRIYSFKEGLSGSYSSFSLRSTDRGKILIGTFQGFYLFSPQEIRNAKPKPSPVLITSIKNLHTSKIEYHLPEKFLVSYDNNSLTIEFAALNYLGSQTNKYRYQMAGLDDDWIETNEHSVNFSAIPSGSYTFRVQLVGADTAISEGSIKINVSTPFWKQAWFQLLLSALGLGIVYLFYRIRLNQVRKEEKIKREYNKKLADVEMKALKAQMNPHFIFNSLNSINRYIVKSEPEKASLYLTKFSKLIRLILDNSNSKIISLENELNALKLYIELEALRFNEKFSYHIQINEGLNPLSVGVPPMIIQPFVENSIWHGLLHKEGPGKLEIHVERHGVGLKCVIIDNGVGRKKASELKSKSLNKSKSYGMKITNDRLAMLNGNSKISTVEIVDLEDESGNALGTKVIVKILSAELEPEF